MSEPRPDAEPAVYTMPPNAYRVADAAGRAPTSTPGSAPEPSAVPERPAEPRTSGEPQRPAEPRISGEPQRPAAPQPLAEPRARSRVWDIVLTVVLLVLGLLGAGLASMFALFLGMASDGCGATNCDYDRMNLGIWVALTAPVALWVVGAVVAVLFLVRRRLAFWVPLAAAALGVAGWMLGAWLVASGVS